MKSFKFIHAADLHLDSPFKGLSFDSPHMASLIQQATFASFDNLIQLALREKVDFIVLAGDIYNQENRSLLAQLHFRDGLNKLARAGIKTFVVHGNHDPVNSLSSSLEWPEEVVIFGGEEIQTHVHEQEGEPLAVVSGISHTHSRETRNLAAEFKKSSSDVFHIGLLHCNLGQNTGHEPYAPCQLQDLLDLGLDYWALGHVHQRKVFHENPHVVYPGNIQGLHINERGEKGCYLVQVQGVHTVSLHFQPLDAVRWMQVEVSIDKLQTLDQLEQIILAGIDAEVQKIGGKGAIFRIVISGRGGLHEYINDPASIWELLQRLREVYSAQEPMTWIKDLQVKTSPDIDLEERREQEDFLGEVLRMSQNLYQSDGKIDVSQMMDILGQLFKQRRAQKALQEISEQELQDLLQKAEILCLDMLERKSD